MADDRFDARPTSFRDAMVWTELFRTFRVALDPKKLLLAAAGILVMASGWWLISVAAYSAWSQPTKEKMPTPPSEPDLIKSEGLNDAQAKIRREELRKQYEQEYNESLDRWAQLHYLAGSGEVMLEYFEKGERRLWGGRLRTMPWYEERGPNPFHLVTKTEKPWERGGFVGWFMKHEVPVLVEPLIKFLEPVVHLLSPRTSSYVRLYLLVVVLWTLVTWALFGGAITRMAAVELTGKEPVTIRQALRFVARRYVSYLCAPLVPFALIAVLVVVSIIFGLLHMIPAVGDILVSGLFWPVLLLVGLGMALLLVGLVGYPLMYPTISTEGSDTLDALSRSYNYVYQAPWQFIILGLVSILYGAAVVFFVGFVGSLTAYLGKWGMSNTPFIQTTRRSPEFLFIYTPTSYGWREMLMEGSPGGRFVALDTELETLRRRSEADRLRDTDYEDRVKQVTLERAAEEKRYNDWLGNYYWYSRVGAAMVAFWITLLFLMILGFAYSFFWTTSTMIYLLMRRKVDDTDLDEVYLEEEETVDPFAAPPASTGLPTVPPPAAEKPADLVTLGVRTDKPAPAAPPPAPPPVPPAPVPAASEPSPAASEPTPPTPPAS